MELRSLLDKDSPENALALCISLMEEFYRATSIAELVEASEKALERLLPCDHSGLYIYNKAKRKFELLIAQGFSDEERAAAEASAMLRHPGRVFHTGESIYVPDTLLDEYQITSDSPRSFAVRSRLYHPVVVNGERIGAFGVVSERPNAFSGLDIQLADYLCKLIGKVYCNIRQVEEIQRSNHELKLLSFLSTHTDNSVVVTDAKGRITWVNEAFVNMSGFTLAEAQGQKPGDLLQGGASDPRVRNLMHQAIEAQRPVQVQIQNYNKSGKAYFADLAIYPFKDDGETVTHFISLQRDITAQHQNLLLIEQQGRKLEAILRSLPDILLVLNAEGVIDEVLLNEGHKSRIRSEHLVGRSMRSLVEASQLPAMESQLIESLSKGLTTSSEVTGQWNGLFYALEVRMAPLDTHRVITVVRNITRDYQIRKERERNQQFNQLLADFSVKLLVSNLSDFDALIDAFLGAIGAFFEVDRSYLFEFSEDGTTMDNTYEWCQSGVTPQIHELQGLPCAMLPWWTNQITHNQLIHIADVVSMPETMAAERELLKEQSIQSLLVLPFRIHQKVVGFYGSDSVKRKRVWSESEIAQMQLAGDILGNAFSRRQWVIESERFRTIFEHAVFGATLMNDREEVLYSNPWCNHLLKLKPTPGQALHWTAVFRNARMGGDAFAFADLAREPYRSAFEMEVEVLPGKRRILLCNTVQLQSDRNTPGLLALTFVDISDRKEQEKATRNALDIVSDQNKRLLNFSYIVSHNIRSHASTLSGFLHLLHDEENREEQRELIEGLLKASKSLDATLRHLNELLNIQSRVGIQTVPIVLHEALDKALTAVSADLNAIPHALEITLPEAVVLHSDQAYFDSILLNLISNAIKYREPKRKLIVSVSAMRMNDGKIQIQVSDNGKGIDMQRYGDKLFGMFKTFHGNSDARGIGLFITRNQMEALGGSIGASSVPDQGTTFTLIFPG